MMYSIEEIIKLKESGFTIEEIKALSNDDIKPAGEKEQPVQGISPTEDYNEPVKSDVGSNIVNEGIEPLQAELNSIREENKRLQKQIEDMRDLPNPQKKTEQPKSYDEEMRKFFAYH